MAAEAAGTRAGLGPHRTAVAAPAATEPATKLLQGLVLHSDGLPARWTPPGDPEPLTHAPAVVAVTLLRDAGSPARPPRDDTTVAVLAHARAGPAS